jgi:hypothetical protein
VDNLSQMLLVWMIFAKLSCLICMVFIGLSLCCMNNLFPANGAYHADDRQLTAL